MRRLCQSRTGKPRRTARAHSERNRRMPPSSFGLVKRRAAAFSSIQHGLYTQIYEDIDRHPQAATKCLIKPSLFWSYDLTSRTAELHNQFPKWNIPQVHPCNWRSVHGNLDDPLAQGKLFGVTHTPGGLPPKILECLGVNPPGQGHVWTSFLGPCRNWVQI